MRQASNIYLNVETSHYTDGVISVDTSISRPEGLISILYYANITFKCQCEGAYVVCRTFYNVFLDITSGFYSSIYFSEKILKSASTKHSQISF